MEGVSPTMPDVMFLRDFIIRRSVREGQAFISHVTYLGDKEQVCRICGSKHCCAYDYYTRRALFLGADKGRRILVIRARRYRCQSCARVFREKIKGLEGKRRSSEAMRAQIAREFERGVSNKDAAEDYGISASTVERIIHQRYGRKVKEAINYPAPQILGIDEHSIRRKGARKYASTIVDLKNHRVYDIVEGRKHEDIKAKLMSYPGRMRVRIVCMDLSSSYRSIVMRCFPNAKIVTDRFHVIRLVIDKFMELCREKVPEIRWQRGIMVSLRKREDRLTPKQKQRRDTFLKANPYLELAYAFKNELCALLNKKQMKASECEMLIPKFKEMLVQMRQSGAAPFLQLANTISSWFVPIIRMWRFTKSNGITEGFHRKMKLIQRRAYGYRNFNNYRLRVLVECS